ncbi:MAG: phosphatidylinositol-specific phospholipase C/glycerophosphodiester phosphodiesterase family protein [Planctomycetota bacterium]|jgi:hypothetical protein
MLFFGRGVSSPAIVLSLLTATAVGQKAVLPVALPQAHAHNDYRHPRPLLDALDHGFTSVEADVFLVDGQLLVGHWRSELRPKRTLEALYLDPLRRRIRKHGGRVYPDCPTFTLLIDVKTDGAKTYAALSEVLARYSDILTGVRDRRQRTGSVTAIISGNRAIERIAADKVRWAGIDGRLSDLDTDLPAHLMPLISDNWRSHFTWAGAGSMPRAEREKLRAVVKKAHGHGRRVRFWNTPEDLALWAELYSAGVDLINTDDLAKLQRFLLKKAKPK